RREGRRRGERAAEGSELALGLGEAEVIEAARRLGALPVVEARLVVGPHLGKRRLAEGPGGGGAHAVESGGRGSAEVGAQDASHARPFRLEGGLAPALRGPRPARRCRAARASAGGLACGASPHIPPAAALLRRKADQRAISAASGSGAATARQPAALNVRKRSERSAAGAPKDRVRAVRIALKDTRKGALGFVRRRTGPSSPAASGR